VLEAVLTYIAGIVTALIAVWKFFSKRVTKQEIIDAYNALKEAIEEYEKAKKDGKITAEELLEIADKVVKAAKAVIALFT